MPSGFTNGVGNTKFAVIIGRHTKIYPEKYREDASTTIIIDEYKKLEDIPEQILEFLPEAVYYDRNLYDNSDHKIGQELAFDLDPENITCPIHGTLADKMKRMQGLSFCELELDMVRKEAVGLWGFLENSSRLCGRYIRAVAFICMCWTLKPTILAARNGLPFRAKLKRRVSKLTSG